MHEWTAKWQAYQEWAEGQSNLDERSPPDIMRDLDFLYRNFPEEVRRCDPDPEKLGIQEMRRILGLMSELAAKQ